MIDRFKDLIGRSQRGAPGPTAEPSVPASPATGGLGRIVPQAAPGAPEPRTAPVPDVPAAPDAPVAPEYEVADAFEFLFATELGDVQTSQAVPGAAAALPDDMIDRIAARVIARLADGPLRESLLRAVRDVAERVVREEIDRIRTAAQSRPR